MKILLISNHPDIRRLLLKKFDDEGHQVVLASHIPEALRLLYKEEPDLIISDNNLGIMEPSELRNLIKLQFSKYIPVIIFNTIKDLDLPDPNHPTFAKILAEQLTRAD